MQPIYTTRGEWVALLHESHLYDTHGDWIGWVDGPDVYTGDGQWVGFMSKDGRILCERARKQRPLRPAPPAPPKIRPPAQVPLAPLFAELPWNQVDVFEEEPEAFKYISELRPDWED